MSSQKSSSFPYKLPLWAQIALGLVFIVLIYIFSTNFSPYVSAWDEEDSNFYDAATQALRMTRINPSATTAIIFWEKDCDSCVEGLLSLQQNAPSSLRIYGVHLSEPQGSEIEIRALWNKYGPRAGTLLIDQQQLLQTSFHVRATPQVFLYLPKQKKIFSFLGNVKDRRKRMIEIITSE